ncbi:MAG: uncharacterized protein A8A55_2522 [Amphiamblys sp. WSBS2006]|nr:MAG: uncharacterized protein A8A55_2522 [Amphiamblys sp. WSBS2006]
MLSFVSLHTVSKPSFFCRFPNSNFSFLVSLASVSGTQERLCGFCKHSIVVSPCVDRSRSAMTNDSSGVSLEPGLTPSAAGTQAAECFRDTRRARMEISSGVESAQKKEQPP